MAFDVHLKATELGLVDRLNENTKVLFEQMFESAELGKLKDKQIILLVDIVFRFITSFTTSRTRQRLDQKKRYLKAKNYYMNRTEEHREEILDGLFDVTTVPSTDTSGGVTAVPADGIRSQSEALFETIGFTSDVVDQLSLMYQEEPERIFLKSETETVGDDLNAQLLKIYKQIGNDKFQRLNDLVLAVDSPLVRVAWRADEHPNRGKSRIWIDIKTPDQYEVITDPDNDTVAEAIFFETRDYDTLEHFQNRFIKFQLWTSELIIGFAVPHQKEIKEVTEVKPNELRIIKVMANPYKKLTFIPLKSKEAFQDFFVDDNSRRFVSAEEQLTVKQLSNNTSAFSQGFSQPFYKTANPTKLGNLKLGPNTVLMLTKGNPNENDDEFGYASNPADPNAISENFARSYALAADRFGVSTEEGTSTSSQSGVSLFISDDKKNKRINSDRPRYNNFEAGLFEIIKSVNNFHVGNLQKGEKTDNKKIDNDVALNARFQKIVTPLSNTERIEKEQFDLDNRLTDRVGILMERNPDITEAQATAIIKEVDERADEAEDINLDDQNI